MLLYPIVEIDILKIKYNLQKIIEVCSKFNIEVFPVIKALDGFIPIIKSILDVNPSGIFDSSISNLIKIKSIINNKKNKNLKLGLIKLPSKSELGYFKEYLNLIDYFLISDINQIKEISKYHSNFNIIIMVDTGDLREGILIDELEDFLKKILKHKNINIVGVATNHACFSGIVPTQLIIDGFISKIKEIEKKFKLTFKIISGGNSSLLNLIEQKKINPMINNIRVGEAMLLGCDVITRLPIKWLKQNTFKVTAEVLEVRKKDYILQGLRTPNAFNEIIDFSYDAKPFSKSLRAIVNLGKKHFYINGIKPVDENIKIIGASSDYLIIDITNFKSKIKYGDKIEFILDYPAIMSLMPKIGTQINYKLIESIK